MMYEIMKYIYILSDCDKVSDLHHHNHYNHVVF